MNKLLLWWHFHQPLYKDNGSGKYQLPWVFLHLIKDYHYFLELALEFPGVKQNFNYSPVLLEQIADYTENPEQVDDPWIHAFLSDPASIDDETLEFILKHFFSVNFERAIMDSHLYYSLYKKRDSKEEYSPDDIMALQTLFFYYWLSPIAKEKNEELRNIRSREAITSSDKELVWSTAKSIAGEFFGLLSKAQAADHLEITASPFYHPILPLLMDTNCVKDMNIPMPSLRFSYPDDAKFQITSALEYMDKLDLNVNGMWPSEGSIDSASVSLMGQCGVKYAGSDERVLFKSLNGSKRDFTLYKYDGVKLFFRDRRISDDIAFKYSAMDKSDSISHFHNHLSHSPIPLIVIMDGENAWEYFPENGLPFLRNLFTSLTDKQVETYTLEHAAEEFDCGELDNVAPGSWIDVGFPLWIGSEGKNLSWDSLTLIRSTIAPEDLSPAGRNALYAAEGSDWNWWYDTFYGSAAGMDFDDLYRLHLRNIASAAKLSLKGRLDTPIRQSGESVFFRDPVKFINPFINGKEDTYYEWVFAGFIDTRNTSGTMKQVDQMVRKIFFGYDLYNLFLRFDTVSDDFDQIDVNILKDEKLRCTFDVNTKQAMLRDADVTESIEFGKDEIIEIRIPFYLLGIGENEDFNINFVLKKNGVISEMHPTFSHISLKSPGKDFQLKNWRV